MPCPRPSSLHCPSLLNTVSPEAAKPCTHEPRGQRSVLSGHLPTGSGTAFHETEGPPCLWLASTLPESLYLTWNTTRSHHQQWHSLQIPEYYCALGSAEQNQVISSLFSISCLTREDPTPSGLLVLSSTPPPPSFCYRHSGLFHVPQTR